MLCPIVSFGFVKRKKAVLLIFSGNIHINSLDEPDEADGFDEIHRKPIQVFICFIPVFDQITI